MRKLKLQVQVSVDGFVAGPNGEMDWMTWNWDNELKNYVNILHEPVDTILLGKNMTDGFVRHWEAVTTKPADESYDFARKMVDTPKVVFSRTLNKSSWNNTELAKGDFVDVINTMKKQPGNDIIVYGGSTFVSSLVKAGLIDEYNLFINPSAIGKGMPIFSSLNTAAKLKLIKATPFACGIVAMQYQSI